MHSMQHFRGSFVGVGQLLLILFVCGLLLAFSERKVFALLALVAALWYLGR